MSKARIDLVLQAYNKLDKNKDGSLTIDDLKGVYNVKQHPKFLNGEWSEDQILRKFLDTFDTKGKEDGKVEDLLFKYTVFQMKIFIFLFLRSPKTSLLATTPLFQLRSTTTPTLF